MESLGRFIDLNFPAGLDAVVDSASNSNEYQEYILGGKSAGTLGWQYCPPFMCPLSRNFGSLNLLEPRPVQFCTGIALPYLYVRQWHLYGI